MSITVKVTIHCDSPKCEEKLHCSLESHAEYVALGNDWDVVIDAEAGLLVVRHFCKTCKKSDSKEKQNAEISLL